jgi:hypothetical protein
LRALCSAPSDEILMLPPPGRVWHDAPRRFEPAIWHGRSPQDRSFVEFLLFGAGASAIRRNRGHKESLSRSASVLSCMNVGTPAHLFRLVSGFFAGGRPTSQPKPATISLHETSGLPHFSQKTLLVVPSPRLEAVFHNCVRSAVGRARVAGV